MKKLRSVEYTLGRQKRERSGGLQRDLLLLFDGGRRSVDQDDEDDLAEMTHWALPENFGNRLLPVYGFMISH